MSGSNRILAAFFGLSSVVLFVGSFVLIGTLNPDFDFASDYISKLGVRNQPFSTHWNVVGFGIVGISLAAFGWFFGLCKSDRLLGTCLVVSGIGFALAAAPTDFSNPQSSLSKVHYASICFSLAGWCCGLARLTAIGPANDFARTSANYSITFALLPMICVGGGISAEPIAHRIVLLVVFVWVTLNSVQLLKPNNQTRIVE